MRIVPIACLAIACLAIAAAVGTHSAAVAQGEFRMTVPANIFFSPSGQPFRGKHDGPYAVAMWMAAADTDKDGKLSEAEFEADATTFFAALDANHDRYISSAENTRYESEVAPEITINDPRIAQPRNNYRAPDSDLDANPGGDRTRYIKSITGASQYSLIDEPQPIRGADGNFDFRISGPEWVVATADRFKVLDRNGDGVLSVEELPKTPLQLALEAPKPEPGNPKGKKKGMFGW